jgi:hypothetical protein
LTVHHHQRRNRHYHPLLFLKEMELEPMMMLQKEFHPEKLVSQFKDL